MREGFSTYGAEKRFPSPPLSVSSQRVRARREETGFAGPGALLGITARGAGFRATGRARRIPEIGRARAVFTRND